MWIAEDIETLCRGVKDGSWIEGTLGAVSVGLDALAFVSDPIGSLLQYGVAWILEHVKPLSEALDWLAGDPGQIAAHAQTWRNVAGALHGRAADLEQAVRWDVSEWTGSAADAYPDWVGQQKAAVGGMARGAETLATITEAAGMLVAGVRMMVRDAIAVLVSRLIVYAAEEVASFGIASVAETAGKYGFSTEDVITVKNHVFRDEHLLDLYGDDIVGPFDANPRMAEAWQRLADGNPHPADIDLLNHERYEA
ncbi:MAG TPA: hypothetical protein VFG35_26530, partial [Actinoplanes sp.]|nr:hypothetical protein [Actinoplanes sp.]